TIVDEIEAYGAGLADKPRITVLNKVDTLDEEEREFLRDELQQAVGGKVMLMSGVSGEGTQNVLRALRVKIEEVRAEEKAQDEDGDEGTWQP
ncbi:MAG: GTPase ObgE, partial [Pseudomonadota bacterium]|nr:GTPase ObgE [Pseudomonadota bacterium]